MTEEEKRSEAARLLGKLGGAKGGNAPRKAMENVIAGEQLLERLTKSVMGYFGRRFNDWREWLEPVTTAFDDLNTEGEEGYEVPD